MRSQLSSLLAILALVVLSASTLASAAPAPKAQDIFPYALKTDRLPNGLTVVRVKFPSPGLVAYYSVVRTGARVEVEKDHTGFAHFFEHMMFKGTKKYPEGEREKVIARFGLDDNAYTTNDCTVYHSFGPSKALEALIEVEADRFANLDYAEPSFQTEAKAVLGEYHKSAAAPELKMEEKLVDTAFTRHTYKHTTLGFYEDIQKMPGYYEYSRQFLKRWYTPDNVVLFVVGDFDDAQALSWIKAKYGPWKGKVATVSIPPEPPQTSAKAVTLEWATPTLPRQVNAWHTPAASLKTTDSAVGQVLGEYLAGSTSPLSKSLILQNQWAESVLADNGPTRDPYLFTVWMTLKDAKHIAPAQAELDKTVAELLAGKVDKARVEAIKSNVRYSATMSLETANAVGNNLAYAAGVLGSPDAFIQSLQAISVVKPEQLVTFAKKYLVPTHRTTLTLTSKTASAAAANPAPGAK